MKRNTEPASANAERARPAPRAARPSPRNQKRNETAAGNEQKGISGAQPLSAQSIELHIDELVLHGFSHTDRRPIADAIERELSALLAREGLPVDHSFEVAHLNGGTFRVRKSDRQESAGASVARAIYGGLRR